MNSFIIPIAISLVLLLKSKAVFHEHAARESAGGKRSGTCFQGPRAHSSFNLLHMYTTRRYSRCILYTVHEERNWEALNQIYQMETYIQWIA